jgi:hypothetical protein
MSDQAQSPGGTAAAVAHHRVYARVASGGAGVETVTDEDRAFEKVVGSPGGHVGGSGCREYGHPDKASDLWVFPRTYLPFCITLYNVSILDTMTIVVGWFLIQIGFFIMFKTYPYAHLVTKQFDTPDDCVYLFDNVYLAFIGSSCAYFLWFESDLDPIQTSSTSVSIIQIGLLIAVFWHSGVRIGGYRIGYYTVWLGNVLLIPAFYYWNGKQQFNLYAIWFFTAALFCTFFVVPVGSYYTNAMILNTVYTHLVAAAYSTLFANLSLLVLDVRVIVIIVLTAYRAVRSTV